MIVQDKMISDVWFCGAWLLWLPHDMRKVLLAEYGRPSLARTAGGKQCGDSGYEGLFESATSLTLPTVTPERWDTICR